MGFMKLKIALYLMIILGITTINNTAFADEARLLLSCTTPPNVNRFYFVRFYVAELGYTELIMTSPNGEVLDYDRSFDATEGYVFHVEGEFNGHSYFFNSVTKVLEGVGNKRWSETIV